MKIKNSLTRLNSCIPLNYHRGMDSYDILIEDSLQSKTRVEPELQNEFFEKAWVCFDVCMAKQNLEDAKYYRELLSRITKTYGH